MQRNIQMVMERWGAWAADNREDVYWPSTAAGFSGLIPSKVRSRIQCCDDDGLILSNLMAGLNSKHQAAHDLLFDHYVFGKTFMQLAREHHCSDGHIGKKLSNAEGIIDGLLMALEIRLEMDRDVQSYPPGREVAA
ncbi:antiterminator Q family protein [Citrobacter freundii]|uniref:Antitermination protein n=1 Tax=Citrobacter freundii TaxID=546 RepID=A0AAP9QBV3_CITFR|nr:antiterminator Q family protein [Citrobacter freundii]QLV29610.1 antitermination protein [Citrobacter freundii]HED1838432.1 antitermination protein [Citrobacter freundii]